MKMSQMETRHLRRMGDRFCNVNTTEPNDSTRLSLAFGVRRQSQSPIGSILANAITESNRNKRPVDTRQTGRIKPMFQKETMTRSLRMSAWVAAILLCAAPGSGKPDKATKKAEKKACTAAYKSAQERIESGRLREAKDQLEACRMSTCTQAQQNKCTAKYNQVMADLPSVVPTVTDEHGAARSDVQVTVDGQLLTTRLDGQPLYVDPGMHEFSFSTTDTGVFATQRINIGKGQRNRTIAASIRSPKKSAPAPSANAAADTGDVEPTREKSPTQTSHLTRDEAPSSEVATESASSSESNSSGGPGALPFIVGGAGLVALGTGVGFLVAGNHNNDRLSECAPYCAQETVDHVSSLYTTANVAFGVGIAAVGVATVLLWTSGPSKPEKPPTQASYRFDVQPTPSGAFATVSGVF